ncbi:MAG: DUF4149 domain-containing protein, partial [Geminicoccales bacterium]
NRPRRRPPRAALPERRTMPVSTSRTGAALQALALLWAGMLLGVAFIAVPAQFSAEGLTRPLGIDITRHVFATFNRVEIGLAALTLVLALLDRRGARLWALLGLVWPIVALQSFWLLPALELRAEQILEGQSPPPGPWHGLYVGSEVTKLLALLLIAWRAPARSVRP